MPITERSNVKDAEVNNDFYATQIIDDPEGQGVIAQPDSIPF